MTNVDIRLHHSVEEMGKTAWSGLATYDNPFVSYPFLSALERHHCVGSHSGWNPHFLGAWAGQRLLGAVPMYSKSNSYGEFVFDWSWADAYRQFDGDYYPKLVVAVPYTPATGPRLLVSDEAAKERNEQVADALIGASLDVARQNRVSSLHWLFPVGSEVPLLERMGLLRRIGVQYHWENQGYRDFQDYLDALSSSKRKMVRRERRRVVEQGIEVRRLWGRELSQEQLHTVYKLYAEIYQRKWGYATLTEGFFSELANTMGDQLLVEL